MQNALSGCYEQSRFNQTQAIINNPQQANFPYQMEMLAYNNKAFGFKNNLPKLEILILGHYSFQMTSHMYNIEDLKKIYTFIFE